MGEHGFDLEKILEKILKEIEDIKEKIHSIDYFVIPIEREKLISELHKVNQNLTNFLHTNQSLQVICPIHQVPMNPILVPDNGEYKLCYHDNVGNHRICPKC